MKGIIIQEVLVNLDYFFYSFLFFEWWETYYDIDMLNGMYTNKR